MQLALMLLLEAATPTEQFAPTSDQRLGPADIGKNLQLLVSSQLDCVGNDPEEVVVCGSRNADERYRIRPLPPQFESSPIRAEARLTNGVSGDVHLESVGMPNGMVSERIMVRIKTKF